MNHVDGSTRRRWGAALRQLSDPVADDLTRIYFDRHPDFAERFGERGRRHTRDDAAFIMSFLAAAVETGAERGFTDFVRWTAVVLESRQVPRSALVESLELIAGLLDHRLDPEAGRAVRAMLAAGVATCGEDAPGARDPAYGEDAAVFVEAILLGDRRAASTVADEFLRRGHDLAGLYLEVLQPALVEVGRRWETNRITVADEHMATAITQYVMARVDSGRAPATGAETGRMVVTGVEGELHQVGAQMVADVLESDGWSVRFLGSNLPLEGVLDAVAGHRADTLGISTTMLFNIPSVRRLVEAARARFDGELQIVLGGAAFRVAPELWRELGADVFAPDIEAARRLLGGGRSAAAAPET